MFEQGLYEQLINQSIRKQLDALQKDNYFVDVSQLDKGEAAIYLGRYVQRVLSVVLNSVKGDDKIGKQIDLCNKIIKLLSNEIDDSLFHENLIETSASILNAILKKAGSEFSDLKQRLSSITPYTRLSQSELFTGGNREITLESELRKEIQSSDEIWFLVSFIKWAGIRIFENELREFTSRGGKLRIITTSYLGATEAKAISFLSELPNTEIKISYNNKNERLHAKAYLFLRRTGFNTGYIGSSNISRSALTNGLEWNIKVTTQEIDHIIKKFQHTFETYWLDREFELYSIEQSEKLTRALKDQKFKPANGVSVYFDLTPFPFQEEILEKLLAERLLHSRYRNLIVAATGTGKTMIAAFDFKSFLAENTNARFLFIAHRKEILEQAQASFRAVLKNYNFGDMWVDGEIPENYSHVFASIQSVNNQLGSLDLPEDFYDYIIIDEVHHIAANSYRPIVQYFKPKILLGLTATPERMDGVSILPDFDDTIAAEIGLGDALNRKLLCPFQYFGITDNVDLSGLNWKRGYLKGELEAAFVDNRDRISNILTNIEKYLTDTSNVRAIGFCASVNHAKYMSSAFNAANLKAHYLVSSNSEERELVGQRLRNKEINYLFVVDIYNEGVDIPEIDTVLFLRPTESLTIFLQQLGRGLRLSEGKDCLTVLDFVGNARPEYNFSNKFRALVGKSNSSIQKEVEDDFPHLPHGCTIVLERKAKEYILANIKGALNFNRSVLVKKLQNYNHITTTPLSLKSFVELYEIPLEHLYKRFSWTELKNAAGITTDPISEQNSLIKRTISLKWLSSNSSSYFKFILKLALQKFNFQYGDMLENEKLMLQMLYYDFWQEPDKFVSLDAAFEFLRSDDVAISEIREVLELLINRIDFVEIPVDMPYELPLMCHSRYTKDQILAAFGVNTFVAKKHHMEGVLNIHDKNTELLFVTLEKTEKEYSPTTMYNDFAINERQFHWQSQNSAGPETTAGKSYIEHEKANKKILLFVRESNKNLYGNTNGFVFLGDARYVKHTEQKPMNITWELNEAIPGYMWKSTAKLSTG